MKKGKWLILFLFMLFCIGNAYREFGEGLKGEAIDIGSLEYREKNYIYNRYEIALVPDKNLRDVLREIIFNQFNETEITQENLKKIKFIYAKDRNIQNIKGLELCEVLESINLDKNKIEDIEVLKSLKNLKNISAKEQNIFIDVIVNNENLLKKESKIENLEDFQILKNDFIDDTTFKLKRTVKEGENIDLRFEKDMDFSGNINLKFIYMVEESLIKDKNLEKEIRRLIKKEKNKEITIEDLEKIKSLNLNNKKITYLDGLENCTHLEEISLNSNNIKDVASLWNLKKLKKVSLRDNRVEGIESIENLKSIKELDLAFNNIAEIDKLNKLANIEILDLSNNRIKDIKVLENLKELKELDISNNNIINTAPLGYLAKLKNINLNGNSIVDFSKITNYKRVEKIDLGNQKIDLDILINNVNQGETVVIKNIFKGINSETIVPEFKSRFYNISKKQNENVEITIKEEVEEYKNYKGNYFYKDDNIEFNGELNICFRDKKEEIGGIIFLPLLFIGGIFFMKNRERFYK